MRDHKIYCGDGVYAEHDGYAITLTTEDGIKTTNRIVLEPFVLKAIIELARTMNPDAKWLG